MLGQFTYWITLFTSALMVILVDGFLILMREVGNGYNTANSVNSTANSFLQCAVTCGMNSSCGAVQFDKNNSQCVSITKLFEHDVGTLKYAKVVGNEAVFGNSSYFLTQTHYDGIQCPDVCNQIKGYYLSTVGSESENNFIVNFIGRGRTCIGGMKRSGSTQYEWVNGEPWNYTNWSPYRVNPSSDKHVVVAYWDQKVDAWDKWMEKPTYQRLKCLCEKDLD